MYFLDFFLIPFTIEKRKQIMIYAYLRVSTETQTIENQRFEILEYCKNKNLIINKFYEETKSGTVTYKDRVLGKLLKKVRKNDIIICSEISRLGRSMYMIMEILNILISKNVSLYTVKEGFNLDTSISSKVISFAFSLSAEIERNLISQRTREALCARKASGVKLGRPTGSRNKVYKLDKYYDKIVKGLQNKESWYSLGKRCGHCGANNVKNYCKYKNLI